MGGSGFLRALAVALAITGGWAAPASAAAPLQPVDDRFQDETILDGLDSPMAVRFAPAPDGRIFVAEKSGRVLAFDDKRDRTPTVTVDLSEKVHDFWDRGLLGMALDPGFAVNGRMYLLYTRDAAIGGTAPRWGDTCPDPPGATVAGCVVSGALVRVVVDELGVGAVDKTLIENEWCQQYPSHSVGTVAFGPDGMLYVSAGEGASFSQRDWGQIPGVGAYPSNPCGDPVGEGGSLRSQDVRLTDSGDPTGLSGAVIRIDPGTGAGAPGNPFSGGDANERRLIAYGLRNPFRFAFRPGTDEIWLGDVGAGSWEEVDVIADADDGVAENFGWPCYEGDVYIGSFRTCDTNPPPDVTPPQLAYAHDEELLPGDGCQWSNGSSISGIAFPSGYGGDRAGNLFFGDYATNCVFAMAPGADGRPDPSKVSLFARGQGTGGPVELLDGPGGDLTYVHYDPGHPTEGSVHRIRYMPGNRAPEPEISATPANGPAPLQVELSAAGTADPDGDDIGYAWDLDGDGAFDDATGAEVTHTYTQPGTVHVGVRATDPYDEAGEAYVDVTAGDTPPRPKIDAPAGGASWSVGEQIAFSGSVADDQETLGPGALQWILTLHHCPSGEGCHVHPLEKITGGSGTISGPEHDYPSRIELTLTAKDSGGLVGGTSVMLEPRAAQVRVTTDTPGTTVSLDGVGGSDVRRTVIAGSRVTVAADSEQTLGDALWRFAGWSDGIFSVSRQLTPASDVTLTARFAKPAAMPTPTAVPAATATPAPDPVPRPLAPELTVERPSARRLAAVVPLRVRCSAGCTLAARARLSAGGATRTLPAPRSRSGGRRIEVRIPSRLLELARTALRRGKPARVRLAITGRNGSGVRTANVTIRLKLR